MRLPQPSTGNIDFGVHVKREYWRVRVGASLLQAALSRVRKLGLKRMHVVRVLRTLWRRDSEGVSRIQEEEEAEKASTPPAGEIHVKIMGERI